MFFIDLLFAFLIALVIAGVLSRLFGGRGVRRVGAWPVFLFLFILLLMMTWAGGVWITPFGPMIWGGYWLPFVSVGFVVALLLAALMPPARPPRTVSEAANRAKDDELAGLALSFFFWIILVVLSLAITAHYVV